MGYTGYEKLRELNIKRWGLNGPVTPSAFEKSRVWEKDDEGNRKKQPTFEEISDLEKHAVHFIRERCEELRFDKTNAKRVAMEDFDGTSLNEGEIPYNFEKDLDRRCLEVSIHRFLESGMAKDAFDVYFCYLEMFIGRYGKTKKMIEMLSEFEANASSLLMKHRDHYVHSVYVFLIGLAFYDESEDFRGAYKKVYGKKLKAERTVKGSTVGLDEQKEEDLAAHFLKYWGLTALFHDIGYPFELSFEQVKSYFGDTIRYVPFVTFNMNNFENPKMDDMIAKAEELRKKCALQYVLFQDETNADLKKSVEALEKMNKELSTLEKDAFQEEKFAVKNLGDKEKNDREKVASSYLATIKALEDIIKQLKNNKKDGVEKLNKLMPEGETSGEMENLNAFLAHALYCELGESYAYYDSETKKERFPVFEQFLDRQKNKYAYQYQNYLYDVLCLKPEHPEEFGGYIDHAYFSAVMLLNTMMQVVDQEELNEMYTHSITAILLHNSLYKYSITNCKDNGEDGKKGFNDGKHFCLSKHPLAYLLMLCDELQCWDRTSYGQNSRGEVHPFDCKLDFTGNKITATYLFDKERYCMENSDELKPEFNEAKGTLKDLKKNKFQEDIENIISINGDESFGEKNNIELETKWKMAENKRYRSSYLSTSNFIHLYKFAVLVHKMNHLKDVKIDKSKIAEYEKAFEEFNLEYAICHISRTKKFAKALSEIGCFYSDKPMDCEIVTNFDEKSEINRVMGPMEHERWLWEHWVMGWRYAKKEEYSKTREGVTAKQVRESTKLHFDMIEADLNTADTGSYEGYDKEKGKLHYNDLSKEDREKDNQSIPHLLQVLSMEDGVKVYRLREKK